MGACRACRHPDRDSIDRQLVAGVAFRAIAASTGLTLGGLSRHKTGCLKPLVSQAMRARIAEGAERGSDLLARIEEVIKGAKGIASAAVRSDNLATANQALNTVLRSLEIVGRITGELQAPSNAGGIHLHQTRITNNVVVNHDSDIEIAQLIGEATNGFDIGEFQRLKQLAELAPKPQ